MQKSELFELALERYFALLKESGKVPRIPDVIEAICKETGLEHEMVKNQLSDPEFDTLLAQRRKRRLIDEVAFKYAAAEAAERIGVVGLEKLTALIENGVVGNSKDADLTAKDLIAAVKLVSDLHGQVEPVVKQLVGGNTNPQVVFDVKEMIFKFGVDGTARILNEANRQLTRPEEEAIDGDCTEG